MDGSGAGRLRHVWAIRYVTPLREGGSLPGLMEADDLGTYAVKFRGAGQGRSALVAEIVSGELARLLGLPVPELCTITVDPAVAAGEPDQEVQDLLRNSAGLNLAMDFLPGALDFDPLAFDPGPEFAGRVLWFDALVGNVDRSWRNSNMLLWHRSPYLIDHGATLTFAHAWDSAPRFAQRPYDAADHVLLGAGSAGSPLDSRGAGVAGSPLDRRGSHADLGTADLDAADRALAPLVTADALAAVTALVPDEWLDGEPGFTSAQEVRDAYATTVAARCAARGDWLPGVAQQVAAGRPRPAVSAPRPPSWLRRGTAR